MIADTLSQEGYDLVLLQEVRPKGWWARGSGRDQDQVGLEPGTMEGGKRLQAKALRICSLSCWPMV